MGLSGWIFVQATGTFRGQGDVQSGGSMSAEDTFKADTETLLGIASYHWEVPEFQREFVWKDRQVNTLLLDINDAWTQAGDDYFLGAIVWFPQSDGPRAVIDGQQRLTTLFLLVAALRDRV